MIAMKCPHCQSKSQIYLEGIGIEACLVCGWRRYADGFIETVPIYSSFIIKTWKEHGGGRNGNNQKPKHRKFSLRTMAWR